KSGSIEGYSYSDANKNSGITWNKDVFLEYIKDPKGKIPGTKMVFAGIKNENEANALWAYISQYDKDGKTKGPADGKPSARRPARPRLFGWCRRWQERIGVAARAGRARDSADAFGHGRRARGIDHGVRRQHRQIFGRQPAADHGEIALRLRD